MKTFLSRRIAFSAAGAAFALLSHVPAAFAASCLPAPSELVVPGSLTVGISTGVPPMAFMNGNTPTGFDVEMGESLAKAMCLKPNLINMPFTGLLPGIDAKKFDLLSASAGITPARKEVFDMTPYFVGGVRLVALQKSSLHFATEYDTCGHSVSTKAGSVEAHALEKVKAQCPADKPMSLNVFPSDNEAMQQLYKGVVDASFLDWPIAAYTIKMDPRIAEASPILSGDGPNTPRHIDGLVIRKGNVSMTTAVNAALKQMMDDGTYQKLLVKYSLPDGDVRSVK
jgi:polar amino acid transport system substrate-binding protein